MNANQMGLPTKQYIENLKREAKRISKSERISHAVALDNLVHGMGFRNWSMFIREVDKQREGGEAAHPIVLPAIIAKPVLEAIEPIAAVVEPILESVPIKRDDTLTTTISKKVSKTTATTKSKKKAPKKLQEWYSLTDIANTYALTIPKAKKELIRQGYMDVDGQPTKKTIKQEACKSSEIESKYTGEKVMYHRWARKIVLKVFKPANELDELCHVKSFPQLEQKFCKVFVRAGIALGLDVTTYDLENGLKIGLTHEEYDNIIKSHFEDAYFLGGPMAFLHGSRPGVEIWTERLKPLVLKIMDLLSPINPSEARFFIEAIKRLVDWWFKQLER